MSKFSEYCSRMAKKTKASWQRDKEAFKSLSGKRKMEFIWDYYKIPLLAVVSVIALVLLGSFFNMGRGDEIMYTVLVNAEPEIETPLFDELLTRSGVELGEKHVNVITNYSLGGDRAELYDAETVQVLAASFAIGDLDLFGADEKVFRNYAVQGAFVDLSLFIEKDLLAKYEDDLITYPNSDNVEIVGGIRFRAGSALHEAGYYDTEDVILGVVAKAQNMDEALAVIRQLMTES